MSDSRSTKGAILPGGRRVEFVERNIPAPGHGQLIIKVKASSICGSDLRAIYREHLGHGPETPRDKHGNNVIGGHEPSGRVSEVGPGCRRFRVGDRVVVYHITGCGVCWSCREGYAISCSSTEHRVAHGWQRDGGHAALMLTEESACVPLLDPLTYADGALIACGVGTAWQGLTRAAVSGKDTLLITGLGPVGMAVGFLARLLGVKFIIGLDMSESRCQLSSSKGVINEFIVSDGDEEKTVQRILELTEGRMCSKAFDCSGSPAARRIAIKGTGMWGTVVFIGEGNHVQFDVSQDVIHQQKTIIGSWVTSLGNMENLVQVLAQNKAHPEVLITDVFSLDETHAAYQLADRGNSGKICIAFDEELERLRGKLNQ